MSDRRFKLGGVLVLAFIMSMALDLLIMLLRGGYIDMPGLTSTQLCNLFYAGLFTPFTYYLLKYYHSESNDLYLMIAILIGAIILQSIVHLYDWEATAWTFWGIPVRVIAIISGFALYKIKNTDLKKILMLFYIISGVLISIPCTTWWEIYAR